MAIETAAEASVREEADRKDTQAKAIEALKEAKRFLDKLRIGDRHDVPYEQLLVFQQYRQKANDLGAMIGDLEHPDAMKISGRSDAPNDR